MNIAISGASGFIGKHLTNSLSEAGYEIVPLDRSFFQEKKFKQLVQTLSRCDVIINLAGAPVNKRWSASYKQELQDSRIRVTRSITRALDAAPRKPELMISASAVGYYPTEGTHDEYTGKRGNGFLPELCEAWEQEARHCPPATRLVITRFGIVLSPDGGAMRQMLLPLKMKLAAVIAPGTQPFPWISIHDLCRAMQFIIGNKSIEGVVNLVSPGRLTQHAFTRAVAKACHAWGTVTIPRFCFRTLYGEGAAFLTTGQDVKPTRLTEFGFRFTDATIEQFLRQTDHATIGQLDLSRYMGRWYEIARHDHVFERGLSNVTATYTLLPDGKVRVENAGYQTGKNGNDHFKRAVGRAKMPDTTQPGKLKVAFFLWFYADYYILELDKAGYKYALIGSSSDKYLWILSRTPSLPDEIKETLLANATHRGYDTSNLLWTDQSKHIS